MIRLRWNNKWINYIKVDWSGTHNQCSRKLVFSIPSNPYDMDFPRENIKLGDLVYLYDDKTQLFVGTVTGRSISAGAGSSEYTAMDFMHHLLRSYISKKFSKKSPEKITKSVCKMVGVKAGSLARSKTNIKKIVFEEQSVYDIIVAAYRKAKARTKKNYMPVMQGKKVSVIIKGKSSGVTLDQKKDITSASYNDTVDNMVNLVRIYNNSLKKVGQVKSKKNIKKYGIYMGAYTKEEGVNAKKAAKAMFVGVTKEASVEAIGNIKAVSGKSITIHDSATGLSGKFYITSDSHTFENGTHMMSLDLAWNNEMEEGAEEVK